MLLDVFKIQGLKLNYKLIESFIRATEYPIKKAEIEPVEYLILRDADMGQTMEYDFIQSVVLGLAKEMNVDIKQRILDQTKFIETLTLNTDMMRNIYKFKKPYLIELLTFLKDILV